MQLRNIDAYVVSAIAICTAVLSVVGDIVPDNLRWAVLAAGMGLLVFRFTTSDGSGGAARSLLGDRHDLEELDLEDRLGRASALWLYAPSGVNFLSQERCDALRSGILARAGGEVRIIVMDPNAHPALELAGRQLDDAVDFVVQRLAPSLEIALARLERMTDWPVSGLLSFRLSHYNPGISLLIIDPRSRDGLAIVEIHGFHGESTSARMHLRITAADHPLWFGHWVDQFEHLWRECEPTSDR